MCIIVGTGATSRHRTASETQEIQMSVMEIIGIQTTNWNGYSTILHSTYYKDQFFVLAKKRFKIFLRNSEWMPVPLCLEEKHFIRNSEAQWLKKLTLHLIRDAPDTDFSGYPAGYKISSAGWIPNIRPDFQITIDVT
jgi:hypothetical protein